MSIFDSMRNQEVSPRLAAACIIGLLAVSVTGILLVKRAVSGPVAPVESSKVQLLQSNAKDVKASPPAQNGEKGTSPAEDACAIIISRNIFRPIAALPNGSVSNPASPAQADKPAVAVTALPPMPVVVQPRSGSAGFEGRSMFGFRMGRGGRSIAFTGIVETSEGMLALIENPATSETRFVAVGDRVFGMDVLEVGARSVLLELSDGQTIRLAMGENKPDSPASTGRQPSDQAQSGTQQAPDASTGQQDGGRSRRWNRSWGGSSGQTAPAQ